MHKKIGTSENIQFKMPFEGCIATKNFEIDKDRERERREWELIRGKQFFLHNDLHYKI